MSTVERPVAHDAPGALPAADALSGPVGNRSSELRSFIGQPSPVVVRMLALAHIRRLRQAYKAFFETGDAERLHDVRVTVRRLRTLLRVYAAEVKGSVRRKDRRRLRAVALGTAALREMDIRFAWVDEVPLEGHEFAAAERLRARDAESRIDEVVAVRKRLESDLDRVTRRLRKRLRRYTFELDMNGAATRPVFAVTLADALTRLRHRLEEQLRRAAAGEDDRRIHAARIAAKRLRYALEPVAALPAGALATAELVRLQDVLGRFLDLGVAIVALDREQAAAHRGENDALVAGLQGLLSRARAERAELLAHVRAEWLDDTGRRHLGPLDAVVAEVLVAAGASPSPGTTDP